MQETLNELALFAGAGGGILGGHLLGWRCVCAVEIDEYCRRLLVQRQNDGALPPFPIWDDVRTFAGKPWKNVIDIVSGGFPCQDISQAGKGKGIEGERSGLWRQMARIVGEVRPRFVFIENSPTLVGRGLALVISDLASMGFDCRWCVLGAADAGAPHIRNRLWILAWDRARVKPEGLASSIFKSQPRTKRSPYTVRLLANSHSLRQLQPQRIISQKQRRASDCSDEVVLDNSISVGRNSRRTYHEQDVGFELGSASQHTDALANANSYRRDEMEFENSRRAKAKRSVRSVVQRSKRWWKAEPAVGRVAHGVAFRVDRIKALGNGQVPAVVKLALETLTR